jgi:hypothetical protein
MYREYNSFYFIKSGSWKKYEDIEMLYITLSNISQRKYTRITEGHTIKNIEYNAYFKLSTGKKNYSRTSGYKDPLCKSLSKLAHLIDLKIIDKTI